jgi:uncharacterized membrane protein YheB (UPF0754 family)
MNFWILLIPVISAFIGWLTNWVAIKMLFHPKEPRKILGITFHGLFPKRQNIFAERLGKLVSNELISFSVIEQKVTNPQNLDKMMPLLEGHIDDFLREKLKDKMPMISMFLGESTIQQFKSVFVEELKLIFPVMMKSYMVSLQSELDLEAIVIDRVRNFSSDKFEEILNQIMSKEFKFIEWIGAVLGFLIGLLQVALTLLAY